jgi:hypothetical protein
MASFEATGRRDRCREQGEDGGPGRKIREHLPGRKRAEKDRCEDKNVTHPSQRTTPDNEGGGRIAAVFKLPVALVNERLGKTIVYGTGARMAVPKIARQSLAASVS